VSELAAAAPPSHRRVLVGHDTMAGLYTWARRISGPAGRIAGVRGGGKGSCAGAGLPDVVAVETEAPVRA
jgi:hypothetical protein